MKFFVLALVAGTLVAARPRAFEATVVETEVTNLRLSNFLSVNASVMMSVSNFMNLMTSQNTSMGNFLNTPMSSFISIQTDMVDISTCQLVRIVTVTEEIGK